MGSRSGDSSRSTNLILQREKLLERVMDDQYLSDWFLSLMDLVRECEQTRGRRIDDDIQVAVLLKRAPKELRCHLVLQSP